MPQRKPEIPYGPNQPFAVMAQGRTDYILDAFPIYSPEHGMMLTIGASQEAVYVTREQAKAFFDLREPYLRMPTFEQEWKRLEDKGCKYGREPLANVRFGYQIALDALTAAPDPIRVGLPELIEASCHASQHLVGTTNWAAAMLAQLKASGNSRR